MATTRSRLSVLTVAFILSAFSASPVLGQATLENPAPGSFQSGISVISGWACEAQRIEIAFNDGPPQEAAYGTSRGDTQATCGDTDNGFGLLFNWNLLGDGIHTVQALADGVEFASLTVIVTTLGEEFLHGASGTLLLADFPDSGASRTLRWQQGQQNFVLTDGRPGRGGGTSGAPPHVLENPAPGSFQSGLGLISGWVCDAQTITIHFDDGPPQEAAYGTSRGDTQGACGDTDNGFGLPFNWNLLDDGLHTVTASADGVEFARVEVTVTTLGTEFRRGLSREVTLLDFPEVGTDVALMWQEAQQNFVITTALPTQRLVEVNPVVTLPAGVQVPNVAVRSLYAETDEVLASPNPSLLLALDGDGTVLLGVANKDGGVLGERVGSVEVSVDSTAVVLVALAAGYAVHAIDQSVVAAIQTHPNYSALISALSTQLAMNKNFLDTLLAYPAIVSPIEEMAAALGPPPGTPSLSATQLAARDAHFQALTSTAAIATAGNTAQRCATRQGLLQQALQLDWLNRIVPVEPARQAIRNLRQHAAIPPAYSECVSDKKQKWQRANPDYKEPFLTDYLDLQDVVAEGSTPQQSAFLRGVRNVGNSMRWYAECSSKLGFRPIADQLVGAGASVGRFIWEGGPSLLSIAFVPQGWVGIALVSWAGKQLGDLLFEIKKEEEAAGCPISEPTAPPAPTNLRITEVGVNLVVLDWDAPVEGSAVSYNVYYRSPNESEYLIDNVSTTDIRVSGAVVPGECYRVSAVSADGVEGEKTAQVCVDEPLEPPRNLRIESTTDTTITLVWDGVVGVEGVEYGVYVYANGLGAAPTFRGVVDNTSVTIQGLEPNERLCITVTAISDMGESAFAPPVCGTTFVLAAPTNLRVVSVTGDSITLAWDAVEGEYVEVQEYRVYWRLADESEWSQARTEYTGFSIRELNADEEYCFAVQAQGALGRYSDRTDVVCAMTERYSFGNVQECIIRWGEDSLVHNDREGTLTYAPNCTTEWSQYPDHCIVGASPTCPPWARQVDGTCNPGSVKAVQFHKDLYDCIDALPSANTCGKWRIDGYPAVTKWWCEDDGRIETY